MIKFGWKLCNPEKKDPMGLNIAGGKKLMAIHIILPLNYHENDL